MVPSYPSLSRVPADLLARVNRCCICHGFGGNAARLELAHSTPDRYDLLALVGLYSTYFEAMADALRHGLPIDGAAFGR